jgi:DNA-binding CsgD family transcriptional regulator
MSKRVKRLSNSLMTGPRISLVIFALIATVSAVDLVLIFLTGSTAFHVLSMSVLTLVATAGAVYPAIGLLAAWREEKELREKLEHDRPKSVEWHKEDEELIRNLNKAIHRQFRRWHLSPTEREIALYLLKGLSLKEIAQLRGSTYGTVKQQAHMLYHKAELGGRSELSAYFLRCLLPEDLSQTISTGDVWPQHRSPRAASR